MKEYKMDHCDETMQMVLLDYLTFPYREENRKRHLDQLLTTMSRGYAIPATDAEYAAYCDERDNHETVEQVASY